MSIPAGAEERIQFLHRQVTLLVRQYGVLLHSSIPRAPSAAAGATDEARVRAAATSITSTSEVLLKLIADLRVDDMLVRGGGEAGGGGGGKRGGDGGSGSGGGDTSTST